MGAGRESEVWKIVQNKWFDGLFLIDLSPDYSDQGKVQKFGRNRRQGDVGFVDSLYSLGDRSKFLGMITEMYDSDKFGPTGKKKIEEIMAKRELLQRFEKIVLDDGGRDRKSVV